MMIPYYEPLKYAVGNFIFLMVIFTIVDIIGRKNIFNNINGNCKKSLQLSLVLFLIILIITFFNNNNF